VIKGIAESRENVLDVSSSPIVPTSRHQSHLWLLDKEIVSATLYVLLFTHVFSEIL
jgi:hypothetical protein